MLGPLRLKTPPSLTVLLLLACSPNLSAAFSSTDRGIVVQALESSSALAQAGVRAEDELIYWQASSSSSLSPGSRNAIETVFDWHWLEIEIASRSSVRLWGKRGSQDIGFDVSPGSWIARVRPWMEPALEEQYTSRLGSGALSSRASALADWRDLLSQLPENDPHRVWFLIEIAAQSLTAQNWTQAYEAKKEALELSEEPRVRAFALEELGKLLEEGHRYSEARSLYQNLSDSSLEQWGPGLHAAHSLSYLGRVLRRQKQREAARNAFERALEIRRRLAPGSLVLTRSLNSLSVIAYEDEDLATSASLAHEALQILETRAPYSLPIASSLNQLGNVALSRGHLDLAETYHGKALEIRADLAAESSAHATSLNNLANVIEARGDLAGAERLHIRALEIREDLHPEGSKTASSLNNLGNVAISRGDLEMALLYHRRALKIFRTREPNGHKQAISLHNLGNISLLRKELEQAERYFQRSLEIKLRIDPESLGTAMTLNSLGAVFFQRGEWKRAEQAFQKALEIRRELAPQSIEYASTLGNLGRLAVERNDLETAKSLLEEELAIKSLAAPDGLSMAATYQHQGKVHAHDQHYEAAEESYLKALALIAELAPDSLPQARILQSLAQLEHLRGQHEAEASYLARAMESLESQLGRLGRAETVMTGFRESQRDIYDAAIHAHLELGKVKVAFETFERSRGQVFLSLLATRNLTLRSSLPEDLSRSHEELARKQNLLMSKLASSGSTRNSESAQGIHKELSELRHELDVSISTARTLSPDVSVAETIEPLKLREIQQSLDNGTILIAFHVAMEETWAFLIPFSGPLDFFSIPIGEDKLRDKVEAMVDLVQKTRPGLFAKSRAKDFSSTAEDLYRLLILPAASKIERFERLLIIPSGPLNRLPFGALRRPGLDGAGSGPYLIEWKPIHIALSATVFEHQKNRRYRSHGLKKELLAWGDALLLEVEPEMLGENTVVTPNRLRSRLHMASERGIPVWPRLPWARSEIETIASLFPPGTAQIFLGSRATEGSVKQHSSQGRILHFATHTFLDEEFPLGSSLMLSMTDDPRPEEDNGLLQAWEILEELRIDADLVVLSACESGLGDQRQGEGIVGLTRAFQYAGARSVMASLWQVDDQATASLMILFYRNLHKGLSFDQALRDTQLALLREPAEARDFQGNPIQLDASAPYFWAPFQIYGDWR